MNLYQEYQQGDNRQEVWRKLRSYGEMIWEEQYYQESWAICIQACQIIKNNYALVINELKNHGYQFCSLVNGQLKEHKPYINADNNSIEIINWLEKKFGKISMMLRAYILYVGELDLNGVFAQFNNELLPIDPLTIEFVGKIRHYNLQEMFELDYESWQESKLEGEKFGLSFSPDYLHKANISGGESYQILLPDANIDAIALIDNQRIFFVDYLNLNFRKNCFRLLDKSEKQEIFLRINCQLENI